MKSKWENLRKTHSKCFDAEFILNLIKDIRNRPVAVGFGISTPEQVKEVSRMADGLIVGSAVVKRIEENLDRIGSFVASSAEPLKS